MRFLRKLLSILIVWSFIVSPYYSSISYAQEVTGKSTSNNRIDEQVWGARQLTWATEDWRNSLVIGSATFILIVSMIESYRLGISRLLKEERNVVESFLDHTSKNGRIFEETSSTVATVFNNAGMTQEDIEALFKEAEKSGMFFDETVKKRVIERLVQDNAKHIEKIELSSKQITELKEATRKFEEGFQKLRDWIKGEGVEFIKNIPENLKSRLGLSDVSVQDIRSSLSEQIPEGLQKYITKVVNKRFLNWKEINTLFMNASREIPEELIQLQRQPGEGMSLGELKTTVKDAEKIPGIRDLENSTKLDFRTVEKIIQESEVTSCTLKELRASSLSGQIPEALQNYITRTVNKRFLTWNEISSLFGVAPLPKALKDEQGLFNLIQRSNEQELMKLIDSNTPVTVSDVSTRLDRLLNQIKTEQKGLTNPPEELVNEYKTRIQKLENLQKNLKKFSSTLQLKKGARLTQIKAYVRDTKTELSGMRDLENSTKLEISEVEKALKVEGSIPPENVNAWNSFKNQVGMTGAEKLATQWDAFKATRIESAIVQASFYEGDIRLDLEGRASLGRIIWGNALARSRSNGMIIGIALLVITPYVTRWIIGDYIKTAERIDKENAHTLMMKDDENRQKIMDKRALINNLLGSQFKANIHSLVFISIFNDTYFEDMSTVLDEKEFEAIKAELDESIKSNWNILDSDNQNDKNECIHIKNYITEVIKTFLRKPHIHDILNSNEVMYQSLQGRSYKISIYSDAFVEFIMENNPTITDIINEYIDNKNKIANVQQQLVSNE